MGSELTAAQVVGARARLLRGCRAGQRPNA